MNSKIGIFSNNKRLIFSFQRYSKYCLDEMWNIDELEILGVDTPYQLFFKCNTTRFIVDENLLDTIFNASQLYNFFRDQSEFSIVVLSIKALHNINEHQWLKQAWLRTRFFKIFFISNFTPGDLFGFFH